MQVEFNGKLGINLLQPLRFRYSRFLSSFQLLVNKELFYQAIYSSLQKHPFITAYFVNHCTLEHALSWAGTRGPSFVHPLG